MHLQSYVILHHFVLSLLAAMVFAVTLELPLSNVEKLVSRCIAAKRAAREEPIISVPKIKRHWLDKDLENPAFDTEKL